MPSVRPHHFADEVQTKTATILVPTFAMKRFKDAFRRSRSNSWALVGDVDPAAFADADFNQSGTAAMGHGIAEEVG